MEEIFSSSSLLSDSLSEEQNNSIRELLVFEYIKSVANNKLRVGEFPQGQDWFNSTTALTLKNHLRGKIVVLDFFTYCCINCIHILPHLKTLEANFSVTDGLVVVGIHSAKFDNEKSSGNIEAAIKRYEIKHAVLNDKDCLMWTRLRVSCWPTVLILGPDTQPIFSLIGEFDSDVLQLVVRCTLQYFKTSISYERIPVLSGSGICQTVSQVSAGCLLFPGKVACHGWLAVSDSGNHRVLIVDSESHQVQFCVGGPDAGFADGDFCSAKFNSPQGIAFLDKHTLYVADTENHAVRVVDLERGVVRTVAGTGHQGYDLEGGAKGTLQVLSSPWDLCFVPGVRAPPSPLSSGPPPLPSAASGVPGIPPPPPCFPGLPPPPASPSNLPGVPPPPPCFPGLPPPPAPPSNLPGVPPPPPCFPGLPPPPAPPPNLPGPPLPLSQHSSDPPTQILLIAMSGTHQLWAMFLQDSIWWKGKRYEAGTCVAAVGNGREENRNSRYPRAAAFAQPSGLCYSESRHAVVVADSESSSVRVVSLVDGAVSAVVGGDPLPMNLFSFGDVDGVGHDAKLQHPLAVACSPATPDLVYIADTYNHKLKVVHLGTKLCTSLRLEGPGLQEPSGLCFDGDKLYVADTNNHALRLVELTAGALATFEIREPVETPEQKSQTTSRQTWESNTCVGTREGHVAVHVTLPRDTHGRWKVQHAEGCEPELRAGSLDVQATVFRFRLPAGTQNASTTVDLDLVLCGESACVFKKCCLKLGIERATGAPDSVELTLTPLIN